MDYSNFINKTSGERFYSAVRNALNIVKSNKDNINFAVGKPNSDTFPFSSIEVTLRDGSIIKISENKMVDALQYSSSSGMANLNQWLVNFQCKQHNLPEEIFREQRSGEFKEMRSLLVTPGSQDALCKVLEMTVSRGDMVLCSEYTYNGFMMVLKPLGGECVTIESDEFGIQVESLEKAITNCSPNRKPRVLYMNPTGANPTGDTIPTKRKHQIYNLCRKYNIIIIEDDPYYYLQFNDLVKSFLSMDSDGRVIRLDSMSKLLSAGIRLGYVTGPKQLMDKIELHMMCSVIHPSSLSQTIAFELLEKWGHDGFIENSKKTSKFYEIQRDAVLKEMNIHLKDYCEWNLPEAGMFIWIKFKNIKDTKKLLEIYAPKHNVILIAGNYFHYDNRASSYARLSYSSVTFHQITKGIKSLAESIEDYLKNEPN